MPSYNVMLRIEANKSSAQLDESLQNFCEDMGYDLKRVTIKRNGSRGRPRIKNPKVEIWMKKRTKPFDNNTFAMFIGVGRSTSWKRLEDLVRKGKIKKTAAPDGRVMYEVIRPDTP